MFLDLRLFLLVFVILFLYSCGIDVPEVDLKLNAPKGLKVEFTTNDTIKFNFWAYNNEDYFSGYVVFFSSNYSDLSDPTKPLIDKPVVVNQVSFTLPTFTVEPFYEPRELSFELPLNSKDVNGNTIFYRGFSYYFAVSAYSYSKKIFSPMSNITNVVLTN
ncbi:MAG: hypothetical protein ACPL4C_05250 [Brevinematia bacterium]